MSSGTVYWLLAGPTGLASSRLQGYMIHAHLKRSSWRTVLLYQPAHVLRDLPLTVADILDANLFKVGDVVVFQKLNGPRTVAVMKGLERRGVRTIHVDCDDPPKLGPARAASLTICSSVFLAMRYKELGIQKTICVPEPYEHTREPKRRRVKSTMTCVWFGSMDLTKANEVRQLRALIRREVPDCRLVVVSDAPGADFKWHLPESWDIIANSDVAVITGTDSEGGNCKSTNRLIQAMALGLPVVAFPVPAYTSIIRNGINGYLCAEPEDWITALKSLQAEGHRFRVATTGYRYARRYFTLSRVGHAWEEAIQSTAPPVRLTDSNPITTSIDAISLWSIRAKAYWHMNAELRKAKQSLAAASSLYWKRMLGFGGSPSP